jgi:hypothetical protein
MSKKSESAMEKIEILFSTLSGREQVEVMTTLYYSMDDYTKDRFLEETENA